MKVRQKYLLFLLISVFLLGGCNTEKVILKESIPSEGIGVPTELKIMFYTVELESEITLMVGEEIEIHARAYDQKKALDNVAVTWSSSDEDSIVITPLDNCSAKLSSVNNPSANMIRGGNTYSIMYGCAKRTFHTHG